MSTSNFRSRATPTATTSPEPPTAHTTSLSAPPPPPRQQKWHSQAWPSQTVSRPRPANSHRPPPHRHLRDALLRLPASDIRALLTQYASGRPRSRTVAKLTNSYDANYGPRLDQLVSFDNLISTIKASLQPFTHKSQAPDPEAIAPTLSPLKQTLNAPNDVFVNIRVLHSMALSPANLAAKLHSLQALVDIGGYLTPASSSSIPSREPCFSKSRWDQHSWASVPISADPSCALCFPRSRTSWKDMRWSLPLMGSLAVVEGFELLMTAGNVVPKVQAMPVDLDPDEEDLDEDEEAEIGDSQELP